MEEHVKDVKPWSDSWGITGLKMERLLSAANESSFWELRMTPAFSQQEYGIWVVYLEVNEFRQQEEGHVKQILPGRLQRQFNLADTLILISALCYSKHSSKLDFWLRKWEVLKSKTTGPKRSHLG